MIPIHDWEVLPTRVNLLLGLVFAKVRVYSYTIQIRVRVWLGSCTKIPARLISVRAPLTSPQPLDFDDPTSITRPFCIQTKAMHSLFIRIKDSMVNFDFSTFGHLRTLWGARAPDLGAPP